MRILQINKHNHLAGGTEKYYLDLCKQLKEKGHNVAIFSMKSKLNRKTRWNKYFSRYVPLDNVNIKNFVGIFFSMIYSLNARRQISKLLDNFKPDIVHVHNIYNHISPSILYEIKKRKIPCIYTLHDYHLLTPNYIFFHNGEVCEKIKGGNYIGTILHKCVRDSFAGTLLTTIVFMIHNLFRSYSRNISIYIAPSKFMKNKMVEYGFNKNDIVHLPNPIKVNGNGTKKSNGKYVLYFGQIYDHKGIYVLADVAEKLPKLNFKVAGIGPSSEKLKKYIKSKDIRNIEFLGYLNQTKLSEVISNSKFIVVPSIWYENMPFSILESFSNKKTVIASNIGGIPELVKHKANGLLFEPGDVDDLAKKIKFLDKNLNLAVKYGTIAKKNLQYFNNPEDHYKQLIKIYESQLLKK